MSTDAPVEKPVDKPVADVSVVLPAHNEVTLLGSTVTNLVTGLDARQRRYEVIVVENGSRDGTLRLARLLAAQLEHLRILSLPVGDYGAALRAGFQAANGSIVVNFDVDYYDLTFFDRAVSLIEDGEADIVVASKRAPGASDRRPVHRRLVTLVFTALLAKLFGMPVSDAHGMKAMRREAVDEIVEECEMTRSLFDVELVLRAARGGIGVREVPAVVVERRPPRSPITRRGLEAVVGLARLRRVLQRLPAGGEGPPASPGSGAAGAP